MMTTPTVQVLESVDGHPVLVQLSPYNNAADAHMQWLESDGSESYVRFDNGLAHLTGVWVHSDIAPSVFRRMAARVVPQVAPAAVKPRPWVRVPRGLLADPRLVEVSGTARTLFCALYPEAVEDPTQGGPAGIGWLLTPAGAPATAGRLALLTKLSVEAVDNAIAELVAAGALTEGQSGAWGIVGWHREAPDTARGDRVA